MLISIKILLILFYTNICWCCDTQYLKINDQCYYNDDINFLKKLILHSQIGQNPPPIDINPLMLGLQKWEDGRLVEFCCSSKSNTECNMDYSLY